MCNCRWKICHELGYRGVPLSLREWNTERFWGGSGSNWNCQIQELPSWVTRTTRLHLSSRELQLIVQTILVISVTSRLSWETLGTVKQFLALGARKVFLFLCSLHKLPEKPAGAVSDFFLSRTRIRLPGWFLWNNLKWATSYFFWERDRFL